MKSLLVQQASAVSKLEYADGMRKMAINQMQLGEVVIALADANLREVGTRLGEINEALATPVVKKKKRRVVKKKLVKRVTQQKKVSKPVTKV